MKMKPFKRIFLVVLDSVGIGAAPDASEYGDEGADTLGNIAKTVGGLSMPNFGRLGISCIREIKGIPKTSTPMAHYAKMKEASIGKDTMTGHWELMGLHITEPFKTFPKGFPPSLLQKLTERTGRKIIGNKPASGTKIIEELGEEHMRTGSLIVYTSADSVLQIAAHEEIIPIDEQYEICEIARELTLEKEYRVGRVIARPFVGEPGNFIRTSNRHDYALEPFDRTVMDSLKEASYAVIALGKISDIFAGVGITESIRTEDNDDGMVKLIQTMKKDFHGLCFLNLVDFDAKYGHRRDPEGYAKALESFDTYLPTVFERLRKDDLIIFTADHGNDPTHDGTDHTREYVPLLVYSPSLVQGKKLPMRETFADVGATIAENFEITPPQYGKSFLHQLGRSG